MAEIGFSRPQGRITIQFPDDMSIAELKATLDVHLGVAQAAMDKATKPPQSGNPKIDLTTGKIASL